MKKNKGITLIALVITIIVLLILAGVAISMLSGENGILKKAADASEKTTDGKRDEATKLSQYEGILNNYSGMKWSLATDGTGKVTGVTNGTAIIKLGAQINYDPYTGVDADYLNVTTPKTKNGYEDQTFEIKDNDKQKLIWQVLGVDDNGQILIMPTANIKNTKGERQDLHIGSPYYEDYEDYNEACKSEMVIKSGKLACQYGAEEINKICSIYGFGMGAIGARSIQVEDIDKLTKFDKTSYSPYELYRYGREITYSLENGKINYQYIGNRGTSVKKESSYTSFSYLDKNEWKELSATNPSQMLKSTGYFYDMSLDPYKANLEDVYNLVITNNGDCYWLGSSYISTDSGYVSFGVRYVNVNDHHVHGCNFFKSYGYSNMGIGEDCGLRPAVSLKPDIVLKETAENSGIYDIQ